jgi:hypothetical protein
MAISELEVLNAIMMLIDLGRLGSLQAGAEAEKTKTKAALSAMGQV